MKSLVTSLPWDRLSILHPGLSRKGPRFGVRVQGFTVMGLGSSRRVQGLGFTVSGWRRARLFDEKMHFPCKLLRVFRVKHEGLG